MQVWKYLIGPQDITEILMQRDATLLNVDNQDGCLCLWALIDPKKDKVYRRFRVAGTGHNLYSEAVEKYVGTVLMYDGTLVLHVFDLGEKST